jgi:hypothetical protein
VKITRPEPSPLLRTAVGAEVLSSETDPVLRTAVDRLAPLCGEALDGLVFFGSRRTGASGANAWSAYDLFAVVADYRPFFAALRQGGLLRRQPGGLALLARWLPPTQISLRFRDPEFHGKLSVIRTDALLRETSSRRHDHFTAGRLFQPTRVVYARNEELRQLLLGALVSACAETWCWLRPWLPASFDAEEYGRRALVTSMAWEIRPEPRGRAEALWISQRQAQLPVLSALLGGLEEEGCLRAIGRSRWAPLSPPGGMERLRSRLYFSRSLLRATARWAKHVLTFEDWLEYLARKASRHTGEPIELTERQRRWPLLLLWGRAYRFLRNKNRKGAAS